MQHHRGMRFFFKASSMVTDLFPKAGARFLDMASLLIMGNRLLMDLTRKAAVRKLRSLQRPEKILVVADLNIGDAVNLQAAFTALRVFFPSARLDYAITAAAMDLIAGNPEITGIFPVFTGRPLPNKTDLKELMRITTETDYDIVFNFCPFFDEKKHFNRPGMVIGYAAMAQRIMRDESKAERTNHIVFQAFRFVHDLLEEAFGPRRGVVFSGVRVTIPDCAIVQAKKFLARLEDPDNETPLIYFNPDASSIFTCVPLFSQAALLRALCKLDCMIVLGRGHTFTNIETELLKKTPRYFHDRIKPVPASLSLEGIAALIDFCDAYVGADTGPLHIAAAKKYSLSGTFPFENRTAVYSVFGATPSRIYGYNSARAGYFPSNQNAPSRIYEAANPCRNMTCINKRAKTCKEIRCFEALNTEEIANDIALHVRRNRQAFTKMAVA